MLVYVLEVLAMLGAVAAGIFVAEGLRSIVSSHPKSLAEKELE